jgi:lactoylglutathione lyase
VIVGPSLTLIVLKTARPDQLKAFYQCLGIQFRTEQHGNGPVHFAAELAQTVLEIYPRTNGEPANESSIWLGFRVDEPEAVLAALDDVGTPVLTKASRTPWGNRMVVQDPDGRPVELYWD